MSPIDIALLALMGLGAYFGFRKGLLSEVIGTLALVAGLVGGLVFLEQGNQLLAPYMAENAKAALPFVSFILLFVLIFIGLLYIGRALRKAVHKTLFGSLDRVFGAALGMLKFLFLASTLVWVAGMAGVEFPPDYTENAFVYPAVKKMAPHGARLFAYASPYLDRVLTEVNRSFPTPL